MQYNVRRIDQRDLAEIRELFATVITDTFHREGLNPEDHSDEIQKEIAFQGSLVEKDVQSDGREEYYLAAESERRVVGVAAFGSANDIIRAHWNGGTIVHPEVKSVYVLPEFQGRGIGTKLFNGILHCLREQAIEAFFLDSGYKRAQQFWAKRLGPPSQILENYWGGNADHHMWHCTLKDLSRLREDS